MKKREVPQRKKKKEFSELGTDILIPNVINQKGKQQQYQQQTNKVMNGITKDVKGPPVV